MHELAVALQLDGTSTQFEGCTYSIEVDLTDALVT